MSKKHYVDNKSFYEALVKYRDSKEKAKQLDKPAPRVPEYIGLCIFQIATKLATKGNFVNYSYKDEMISDGIENCILYMDNFDPTKSKNPFAYFTRIIYNAYILRIQKEKKQTYIKYKSMENSILQGDSYDVLDDAENVALNIVSNENVHDFVRDYEQKINLKKTTKKIGIEALLRDDSND